MQELEAAERAAKAADEYLRREEAVEASRRARGAQMRAAAERARRAEEIRRKGSAAADEEREFLRRQRMWEGGSPIDDGDGDSDDSPYAERG